MPANFSTTDDMTEAQKVAQILMNAYAAVAYSEDNRIAAGWKGNRPVYGPMQRAVIAAIRIAYDMTELKAQRVLNVYQDCNESVPYCVNYVRTHRSSHVYDR